MSSVTYVVMERNDTLSAKLLLTKLIQTNFNAFFVAHAGHVVIKGEMFEPDHQLLKEVYEVLYDQHDILAEQLVICEHVYPFNGVDDINNGITLAGRSRDAIFTSVLTALETAEREAIALFKATSDMPGANAIAADYYMVVSKLRWKVSCVLK